MRVSALVILFGVVSLARSQTAESETFLDKFRYGIELIHRLFSSDAASHFGTFFTGAFKAKPADNFAENVLKAIIKTIGGNEEDIGITAIRMSAFVAKMISDAFPQTGRSRRSGDNQFTPLDTILRQPQVRNLITDLRDPELTDRVAKELRNDEDIECVRLLICKLRPFVRGMQRSLNFFVGGNETKERDAWAKSKPMERMYLFMPGMNEFLENGDACDERHPSCDY